MDDYETSYENDDTDDAVLSSASVKNNRSSGKSSHVVSSNSNSDAEDDYRASDSDGDTRLSTSRSNISDDTLGPFNVSSAASNGVTFAENNRTATPDPMENSRRKRAASELVQRRRAATCTQPTPVPSSTLMLRATGASNGNSSYPSTFRETRPLLKCKIVVVGEWGVGKTALMQRLVADTFALDSTPTTIVDFATADVQAHDSTVRLEIWDTAGQERFASIIMPSLFRNISGALVVFSLTSRQSFESAKMWVDRIEKQQQHLASVEQQQHVPLVLVGNKMDAVDPRQHGVMPRAIEAVHARLYAEEHSMQYIETSALTNTHVMEAFRMLARRMVEVHQGGRPSCYRVAQMRLGGAQAGVLASSASDADGVVRAGMSPRALRAIAAMTDGAFVASDGQHLTPLERAFQPLALGSASASMMPRWPQDVEILERTLGTRPQRPIQQQRPDCCAT